MTALERQMAADAVALSKEHADRADAAQARWNQLRDKIEKALTFQRKYAEDTEDARGTTRTLNGILEAMDGIEARQ